VNEVEKLHYQNKLTTLVRFLVYLLPVAQELSLILHLLFSYVHRSTKTHCLPNLCLQAADEPSWWCCRCAKQQRCAALACWGCTGPAQPPSGPPSGRRSYTGCRASTSTGRRARRHTAPACTDGWSSRRPA
jgi:hypothetical protein